MTKTETVAWMNSNVVALDRRWTRTCRFASNDLVRAVITLQAVHVNRVRLDHRRPESSSDGTLPLLCLFCVLIYLDARTVLSPLLLIHPVRLPYHLIHRDCSVGKWDDILGVYSPFPRVHFLSELRAVPVLIFTQSFYNVVSTTVFTKRRAGVTLVLLYTFHYFPSTLQGLWIAHHASTRTPVMDERRGHYAPSCD
jgi:hypothetical protein